MNKPNKDDKSPIEKGMEYLRGYGNELCRENGTGMGAYYTDDIKQALQIAVTSAREETDLVLIENIRDWLINNIEYKLPDMLELFDKRFLPKRDKYIQSKNKKVER